MTENITLFNRPRNPRPDSFQAMLCQIIIQTQNHQVFCSLDLFNAAGSFFILTQQVIFLVVRVPLYPGNPVISHPKNHLASPSLREHGQILQQAAQSTSQRQKTWREIGASGRYLSEVEIVLEGQRDISVDVNLLLPINVIWTHLSSWHSTFPWELQPLEDSIPCFRRLRQCYCFSLLKSGTWAAFSRIPLPRQALISPFSLSENVQKKKMSLTLFQPCCLNIVSFLSLI